MHTAGLAGFIWAQGPAGAAQAGREITAEAICDYNFKPQMPLKLTFAQKIFSQVIKLQILQADSPSCLYW